MITRIWVLSERRRETGVYLGRLRDEKQEIVEPFALFTLLRASTSGPDSRQSGGGVQRATTAWSERVLVLHDAVTRLPAVLVPDLLTGGVQGQRDAATDYFIANLRSMGAIVLRGWSS